jgi:hypothetical protein
MTTTTKATLAGAGVAAIVVGLTYHALTTTAPKATMMAIAAQVYYCEYARTDPSGESLYVFCTGDPTSTDIGHQFADWIPGDPTGTAYTVGQTYPLPPGSQQTE